MKNQQYGCSKCGNKSYEHDQFQSTGGNFAKIFDVQNKKFTTIACTNGGFTDLYRQMVDSGMDIIDFLMW